MLKIVSKLPPLAETGKFSGVFPVCRGGLPTVLPAVAVVMAGFGTPAERHVRCAQPLRHREHGASNHRNGASLWFHSKKTVATPGSAATAVHSFRLSPWNHSNPWKGMTPPQGVLGAFSLAFSERLSHHTRV